jgi:hypothetical protein
LFYVCRFLFLFVIPQHSGGIWFAFAGATAVACFSPFQELSRLYGLFYGQLLCNDDLTEMVSM